MAKPGKIHQQMAELLRQHPDGLTSGQLREKLGLGPTEQAQLDRRRRDLKKWYLIEKKQQGRDIVYIYKGTRDAPLQAEGVNWRQSAREFAARGVFPSRRSRRPSRCGPL